MITKEYHTLTTEERTLLFEALDAAMKAHAPYSHFFVGAAIRMKNGDIISASNVENAAYPLGTCAERSAIVKANSEGRIKDIVAIAVIAYTEDGKGNTIEPTAPCGGCRQEIFEVFHLSGVDTEVIIADTKMTKVEIWKISELLPRGFGPNDLKKKIWD